MRVFLFFFIILLSPLVFGFSETEINLLESSGDKPVSLKLWRAEFSFSGQRNLDVKGRYAHGKDFFDPNKQSSLFDISVLYYVFDLDLRYSLKGIAKNSPDFIKKAELFLTSSYRDHFKSYYKKGRISDFEKYFIYPLGDIDGGFSSPLSRRKNFFSRLSVSLTAPLSQEARIAKLVMAVNGGLSLIYFLQKKEKSNLALSSNHNLSYGYYGQDLRSRSSTVDNIPWDTSNSLSLIYRQSHYKYAPSNVSLFFSLYHGMGKRWTLFYDYILGLSSSWKINQSLYFNFFFHWKDRNSYNLKNKKRNDKSKFHFGNQTFFSLGGSYSF